MLHETAVFLRVIFKHNVHPFTLQDIYTLRKLGSFFKRDDLVNSLLCGHHFVQGVQGEEMGEAVHMEFGVVKKCN